MTAKKEGPTQMAVEILDKPAAVWVNTSELVPWEDNPRKNDGTPVRKVAESIKRFGFGAPILARTADRMVIAGHTRLKAAIQLGLDRVPVRFLDLDPAEARLLALADNRFGELAQWDDETLRRVLAEMKEGEIVFLDFDSSIFDADEEELFADPETITEGWSVLVECDTEENQAEVMQHLEDGGFPCRALIL